MIKTQIHRLSALAASLLFGAAIAPAQTIVGWGDPTIATAPAGVYRSISAGSAHVLGLNLNGTVTAWGSNSVGQATVPAGLTSVKAVAAGSAHSLALNSGGTVVQWGGTSLGQGTVPAGLTGVVAIAAGFSHSLAVKSDRTVVQWGDTSQHQGSVPANLTGVAAIAAGDYHSLALKSNGTVVQWGDTSRGQGTVPAGLTGVIAIAAGSTHSLALKNDGTVVQWGDTTHSQGAVPAGLTGVIAIEAGSNHSLALKSGGTVVAWGFDSVHQTEPPAGLTGVVAINAGGNLSLAIQSQTQAVIWGTGLGSAPATSSGYKMLAAGYFHALGLQTDGTVAQWGDTTHNQGSVPAGLTGVKAVAAGEYHSLALKSDGTVVQWGDTANGQGSVPAGLNGVVGIGAGIFYSLALKSDGTVVQWGYNFLRPGPPANLTGAVAVAAGGDSSLALNSDGTLSIWGDEIDNQLILPAGLTGVIAMAGGDEFWSALKSDGTVVGWGIEEANETNVPAGLTDVIALARGIGYTVALQSAGTVVVWGDVAKPPSTLESVVSIAGGETFGLALVPPSIPVTINSTPPGLSFTLSGAGCLTGSYTTPQTFNWAGLSCTAAFAPAQSLAMGTRYVFTGWADGGITANPRTFPLPSSAASYTANYTTQYRLSTVVSPSGSGTISGAGFYVSGSQATVTASAKSEFQFANWTGPVAQATVSPTTVAMTGPQTVTANFQLVSTVAVSAASAETGQTATLTATVGPSDQAFTGTLQFNVANVTVGSTPVTGSGVYTVNYTVTQGAGAYPISVSLSPSTQLVSSSSGSNTLTVTPVPIITFPAIPNTTLGTPVTLIASVTSGPALSFTSLTTTICTVTGNVANLVAVGICKIQASQAGSVNFTPAAPVSVSFTVTPVPVPLTVVAYNVLFGSKSYNLLGSARNRLPWQITGIQVVFSAPVGAATASSLSGVTPTAMTGLGTNTLTFAINPLSIGTFATSLAATGINGIADPGGNPLAGGTAFTQTVKVLWGDVNDDGVVSASDLTLANNAQTAPYNVIFDANGDGVVNTADVALIRTKIGTSLP